jgi:hypothetical protein
MAAVAKIVFCPACHACFMVANAERLRAAGLSHKYHCPSGAWDRWPPPALETVPGKRSVLEAMWTVGGALALQRHVDHLLLTGALTGRVRPSSLAGCPPTRR